MIQWWFYITTHGAGETERAGINQRMAKQNADCWSKQLSTDPTIIAHWSWLYQLLISGTLQIALVDIMKWYEIMKVIQPFDHIWILDHCDLANLIQHLSRLLERLVLPSSGTSPFHWSGKVMILSAFQAVRCEYEMNTGNLLDTVFTIWWFIDIYYPWTCSDLPNSAEIACFIPCTSRVDKMSWLFGSWSICKNRFPFAGVTWLEDQQSPKKTCLSD